ncbi:MAG: hypothetical protein RMM53_11615, partial [Bacteroidia bacterium]|nr:hypothetical protein [Bacteroidia bacterium]MDW8334854.1 hypothetical protein [Bacteroidia bacterium]
MQTGFLISGKCKVSIQSISLFSRDRINLAPQSGVVCQRIRLPETINSRYSEISPIVSSDGSTLYFTVHGSPENTGYDKNKDDQDVYFSTNIDGKWTEKVRLPPPVNSPYANAVCGILADGLGLLLGGLYPHYSGLGPLMTFRSQNRWIVPKPLPIPNFYNDDEQYGFALSPDGNAVVMSLKRKDALGKRDLYVSVKNEQGVWSEPRWMGPIVNTRKTETEPYLAADGRTLYFASDGRKGFGKCDLYVTRRLSDAWTEWSEPFNLGPNFNTRKDEFGISVDALSGKAFFSSAHQSLGGTDVFCVETPKFAKPRPTLVLKGNMDTDAPVSIKVYDRNRKRTLMQARAENGKYQLVLPTENAYFLEWTSEKNEVYIAYYDATDLRESKCETMDVVFKEILPPPNLVRIKAVASEDPQKQLRFKVSLDGKFDVADGEYVFEYTNATMVLHSPGRLPVFLPVPAPNTQAHIVCLDPIVVPQSYLASVGANIAETLKHIEKGKLMF